MQKMETSFTTLPSSVINLFVSNCIVSVAKDCFTLVRMAEVTTRSEPDGKIVICIVHVFEPFADRQVFERDIATSLRHISRCVEAEICLKFPSHSANVLVSNGKTSVDASGCCSCLTVEVILN